MVTHTRRFSSPHREIRKRIQEGTFHLHHMVVETYFFRRTNRTCTASRDRGSTTCSGITAATRWTWRTGSSTSPNWEVWGQKGPDHPELRIPMDITVGDEIEEGAALHDGDVVQQQGPVRRVLPLHR